MVNGGGRAHPRQIRTDRGGRAPGRETPWTLSYSTSSSPCHAGDSSSAHSASSPARAR